MSVDESTWPLAFRQGLDALRKPCPEAVVAADDANFAIIDLGNGEPPEGYVEREMRLFVRSPFDFLNAVPYGVITRPFLTRKDGKAIGHQHVGHASAQPVQLAGSTTGFWSWDWKAMPHRRPEDMAALYEWAWKCLRDGAA